MIKKSLVIAGLSLLCCNGVCTAQTATVQSKKTDWAQFYRYRASNEAAISQGGKVDAVFMGNSITDFWVDKDSTFFASNHYIGRGISGQTSSEMLVRFRRDVIDLRPRVVVILAGTNDIAGNIGKITLEDILGNIKSMCEISVVHGITPILCSIVPCDNYYWKKESRPADDIRRMNSMIKDYALSKGYEYIDYHTPMANENGGLKSEYTKDGCHPNLAGYLVMEKVAKPIIDKVLSRK